MNTNILKKILTVIMATVLISGMMSLNNSKSGCASKVNAQVNMTAEDAIEWVKSKVGQSVDVDYVYGAQCVDLIKAYYTFLGFCPVKGNGSDYTFNVLPPGYVRIQGAKPQKGDVLVYTGGSKGYGHVAIYESDYSHYHQNYGGNQYVMHITHIPYDGMTTVDYWGVIRPDFRTGSNVKGYLDSCHAEEGSVYVSGWAVDFYDKNKNLDIYIYVGGAADTEGQPTTEKHVILADSKREDVDKVYSGVGINHGYTASLPTELKGEQSVYVYAVNSAISDEKFFIGSTTVNIAQNDILEEPNPDEDDSIKDSVDNPSEELPTETESETPTETESSMETPIETETESTTETATESPTESTTEAATEPPTESTTEAATESPTESTTETATESPTESTTETPTEPTTEAPTEPPTETATEPAIEAPTESPTEAATEQETELPTEAATEQETEPLTEVATELPTETATEPSTKAETELPTETVTEQETEPPTEAATEPSTEVATEQPTEEAPTESPVELPAEGEAEKPTEPSTDSTVLGSIEMSVGGKRQITSSHIIVGVFFGCMFLMPLSSLIDKIRKK